MDKGVEVIKLGWKEYLQQPVLPASLAYVLLYFNIVLTPGSLMTAYLTQSGIVMLCPFLHLNSLKKKTFFFLFEKKTLT